MMVPAALLTFTVNAQDVVTLTDGTELKGKVTEVTVEGIKMKKADNPDGPTYAYPRKEVAAVKYDNGQQEMFSMVKPAPAPAAAPATPTTEEEEIDPRLKYNGPRFGMTWVGPGAISDKLEAQGYMPTYTQFGWQFETRIWSVKNGPTGVVEFVPLIAGLEKGTCVPNMSLLLGVRSKTGYEFGVGPNAVLDLTAEGGGGFGLVMAAGASIKRGKVIFPVNIAFVPTVRKTATVTVHDPVTNYPSKVNVNYQTGMRISLVIGFNTRTK